MLSAMEYPHWLMVAGTVLVVLGFIGFAFRQTRTVEPDHEPTENEGEEEMTERKPEPSRPSRPAFTTKTQIRGSKLTNTRIEVKSRATVMYLRFRPTYAKL